MSESQTLIHIPYYTKWSWALFALSCLLFLLSISIRLSPKKETKAELLISYIILSSCMFIGTIPFIIKTFTLKISDDNVKFYVPYLIILIISILNFTYSGILLNKLDKEEEEEIKNYSGVLIILSLLFFVLYVVSSTFECKKEKEYVYQPSEAFRKAVAEKLKRKTSQHIQNPIQNPNGNLHESLLSSSDTTQHHYNSTNQGTYQPPQVLAGNV